MASKGKPYRTVIVDGFEILIGKGDEENDRLTFDVGAPDDVWLHVGAGTAGSHVIIRNPEKLETCAIQRAQTGSASVDESLIDVE